MHTVVIWNSNTLHNSAKNGLVKGHRNLPFTLFNGRDGWVAVYSSLENKSWHDFKTSECHHSKGIPMDGARSSSKTNRDHLMKDNLGHYCPNTYLWNGKGKERQSGAAENWTQGLWRKLPVLCHWATTPTDNHSSFSPLPFHRSSDSNGPDYISL